MSWKRRKELIKPEHTERERERINFKIKERNHSKQYMVLGCIVSFAIDMLKRRASKRFVLAESGEPTTWDSSVDSNPNITVDRNANSADEMSTQNVSPSSSSSEMSPTTTTATQTTPSTNHLTVPKTTTVELNQGLK